MRFHARDCAAVPCCFRLLRAAMAGTSRSLSSTRRPSPTRATRSGTRMPTCRCWPRTCRAWASACCRPTRCSRSKCWTSTWPAPCAGAAAWATCACCTAAPTSRRIHLRYTLAGRRRGARSGDEWVSDLDLRARPASSRRDPNRCYYEKRMLDRWFKTRFVDGRAGGARGSGGASHGSATLVVTGLELSRARRATTPRGRTDQIPARRRAPAACAAVERPRE